ncbi:ABC transporter ATP-binding protein, partial [Lactobacillus crispatus]
MAEAKLAERPVAATGAEVLTIQDLQAWYGESHILHGINFNVKAGEVVTLLGRNGAGKTTLLRALSGVQPITGGEIHFLGARIDKLSPHRRVARGMTQSPEGRQVFGPLSVDDNLRLGAYMRRDGEIER